MKAFGLAALAAVLFGTLAAQAGEEAALKKNGSTYDPVPPRYHTPYFAHAFSGGYAAGYYDYIWADTLTADAAEAFAEAPGGFFDKALARELLDDILSVGDTVDAAEAFRRFRGRDASVEPLMRDRGFVGA